MAETRLDKIIDKVLRPRYILPFIGIMALGQVTIWIKEGEKTLEYIKEVERSYTEDIENQYNSLPEKIKPYDLNKDGLLELEEINKLEQELLR